MPVPPDAAGSCQLIAAPAANPFLSVVNRMAEGNRTKTLPAVLPALIRTLSESSSPSASATLYSSEYEPAGRAPLTVRVPLLKLSHSGSAPPPSFSNEYVSAPLPFQSPPAAGSTMLNCWLEMTALETLLRSMNRGGPLIVIWKS